MAYGSPSCTPFSEGYTRTDLAEVVKKSLYVYSLLKPTHPLHLIFFKAVHEIVLIKESVEQKNIHRTSRVCSVCSARASALCASPCQMKPPRQSQRCTWRRMGQDEIDRACFPLQKMQKGLKCIFNSWLMWSRVGLQYLSGRKMFRDFVKIANLRQVRCVVKMRQTRISLGSFHPLGRCLAWIKTTNRRGWRVRAGFVFNPFLWKYRFKFSCFVFLLLRWTQVIKGKPLYVGLAERREARQERLRQRYSCLGGVASLVLLCPTGEYLWTRSRDAL